MYNVKQLVERINGDNVTRSIRLILNTPMPKDWFAGKASTTLISGMHIPDVAILYFHTLNRRCRTRDKEELEECIKTLHSCRTEWNLEASEYDVDIWDLSYEFSIGRSYEKSVADTHFHHKTFGNRFHDYYENLSSYGIHIDDLMLRLDEQYDQEDTIRGMRLCFDNAMMLTKVTWWDSEDQSEGSYTGKYVMDALDKGEHLSNYTMHMLRLALYGKED